MAPDSGERLDRYIVRLGLAPSRRAAQELIAHGLVRVNGARFRKAQMVTPVDKIEVLDTIRARSIEPNADLEIEILYADDSLIVVNKPGLMPCHPLRSDERNTVMNGIVAQFPETAAAGDQPREGGLVHRLDNGTSGALLIARTQESFAKLRAAIRGGKILRTYEALVAGNLPTRLELNHPIAHHPVNPEKMTLGDSSSQQRKRAGRIAVTIVEPIRRIAASTLVRVTPRTGSRHQIRVHLANAGFPIVGDVLYGGPKVDALLEGRFWLHLREVELGSPAAGRIKVTAPPPSELMSLIR
ncbi:MAG TPA: RluA family pseudouridine synthase [Candidatus Binataceae bacterium]|nr:RluA family pseudouridine synthase [Candidatus Binataceae bacterium]